MFQLFNNSYVTYIQHFQREIRNHFKSKLNNFGRDQGRQIKKIWQYYFYYKVIMTEFCKSHFPIPHFFIFMRTREGHTWNAFSNYISSPDLDFFYLAVVPWLQFFLVFLVGSEILGGEVHRSWSCHSCPPLLKITIIFFLSVTIFPIQVLISLNFSRAARVD